MKDQYERVIDYMRISITDRCNLRCRFCMPKEPVSFFEEEELLRADEILMIAKASAALGIKHFRLTGGEPLLRKELVYLVSEIRKMPGVETVSLTTNGILLEERRNELYQAGLTGVNISLCSTDAAVYQKITGVDGKDRVMSAIKDAVSSGIRTKINCVPMPGENTKNLIGIAELARQQNLAVRFIEMMPVGVGAACPGLDNRKLLAQLKARYGMAEPVVERLGNGPAVYYQFPGFLGQIGFISANSSRFCGNCNRIRLTAEGYLRLCLDSEEGICIKDFLRKGCTQEELLEELKEELHKAIWKKPPGHHFKEKNVDMHIPDGKKCRYMAQIGG